jgi:hypothetical protein
MTTKSAFHKSGMEQQHPSDQMMDTMSHCLEWLSTKQILETLTYKLSQHQMVEIGEALIAKESAA